MTPPPPTSTLFPYTTLFRSHLGRRHVARQELEVVLGQEGRGFGILGQGRLQLGRGRVRHSRLTKTAGPDRKSTRLNSSHSQISYAVFCLKKKRCDTRCCSLQ